MGFFDFLKKKPQEQPVVEQTEEKDVVEIAGIEVNTTPEKEEEEAEAEDDTDETADSEDDLMSWIVKDEAGSSEQPNLVIKGEFKGMGPLAIFTKDAK